MAKFLIQDIIPPEKKKRVPRNTRVTHHTRDDAGVIAEDRAPRMSVTANEAKHELARNEQVGEGAHHYEEARHNRSVTEEPRHSKEEADITESLKKTAGHAADFDNRLVSPEFSFISPERGNFIRIADVLNNSRGSGWIKWLVGTIVFLIVLFGIFQYFAKATITITPKREGIPLSNDLSASMNAEKGTLSYGVARVTLSDTTTVPASGNRTLTEKASGQIVVYNEQSLPQRLIKNTRFQTPKGLIYRINESITVPRATTKSGKLYPGIYTVSVYADEAGPSYNIEPTDFTLPGLKGSPTFAKVYARSKGPITGGASGIVKVVSDADLKNAGEQLRISLETKLRNKVRSDIVPGQIAYDQGIVVSLGKPVLSNKDEGGDNKAVVTEEGTIWIVVFDRKGLTSTLAKQAIEKWGGEPVIITNLEKLTPAFAELNEKILAGDSPLLFSISGTANFEWVIDETAIKKDVAGLRRSKFNELMATYPMVAGAKANIVPQWKRYFPDDPQKIEIINSSKKT